MLSFLVLAVPSIVGQRERRKERELDGSLRKINTTTKTIQTKIVNLILYTFVSELTPHF